MTIAALLVFALAACTDADGPQLPQPHDNVTVLVLRDEQPVPGAAIVFHDANGHVLGDTRTDAAGAAAGAISMSGMVTVIDPQHPLLLFTITRVAVDSSLEVLLTPKASRDAPAVNLLTIAAPTTSPPTDTAGYEIRTPCGRELTMSLPASIPVPARCEGDAPVVLTAHSTAGSTLAYVAGRASSGRFQPGAWSTQCTLVAVNTGESMSVQLWPKLGGHAFQHLDLDFCGTPAASMQPTLDFGEGGVVLAHDLVPEQDYRSAELLHDLTVLPAFVEVRRTDLLFDDVTPWFDFTGSVARWTSKPGLGDADAIDAHATWSVSAGQLEWRFVLPGNATELSVPELPLTLMTWNTLDGAVGNVRLNYIDASWQSNLQDVEMQLLRILDGVGFRRSLAPGGTLRMFGSFL